MTYTGYHDIKPGQHRPQTVEEVLSHVARIERTLGKSLNLKAIDTARNAAQKMQELRTAHASVETALREELEQAGSAYAAGEVTARDVVMQAISLTTAITEKSTVARLVDQATAGINRDGLSCLAGIGDKWLTPLKAHASELIAQANEIADRLDHGPQASMKGTRQAGHPWAPSRKTLDREIDTRHAWEKLETVLSQLDATHHLADTLRNMGYLPCVADRTHAEDYRWRHVDQLIGNPVHVREFFLANRHAAEPGIYAASDLESTAAPRVIETGIRPDAYNAAVLAGRV